MKYIARFLFVLVLAVTLALPAYAIEGLAPEFEVGAEGVYLVNTDTNLVVYEKNSETSMQAASLTKLMTMVLLLKSYQDQLDTITVTAPGYIYDILYNYNASTADIWRGETHTLRTLLYAMALPSGNEAAYIVADYMGGGSVENFVAMMNAEAAAIGCTGTTFTDPCGLESTNVTTARDIYLILRAAIQYDAFVQAAAATSYTMPASIKHESDYLIQTTNRMLVSGGYYRAYTQGGKTGTLQSGWQNFAGWHTQDGETYISAVLHSPDAMDTEGNRPALVETAGLVDWAFSAFAVSSALDTTQPISELPIAYSTQTDTIMLYPADDMQTLLPREGGAALTEQTFDLPERLTAPIQQGDVVGTVTLSIQGEKIGTVDLIAGSTIERNQVLYTMARVVEFFSSTYFKVVVILAMVAIAIYAFLWVLVVVLSLGQNGSKRRR